MHYPDYLLTKSNAMTDKIDTRNYKQYVLSQYSKLAGNIVNAQIQLLAVSGQFQGSHRVKLRV
jgi:hypothetical protein